MVLVALLFVSVACVDPNGNLNLLTGATTNSLTSESNEINKVDVGESDVMPDEIPVDTGIDATSEPITMPVTISKLDSDFLIKATYVRGEAVLDEDGDNYETTLWSWLHGTAIASDSDDMKVMVYGAEGCVEAGSKLTVSVVSNESTDADTSETDGVDTEDENDLADSGEVAVDDYIELEANEDGAFEFTVPRLWIKREMLIKHASVPEGEDSNAVSMVVGKKGDYSAMITDRAEKIDSGAKLMVHNNLVFYDKADKTGAVYLINCHLDGDNCHSIAKIKSTLDQKIFFTPKDKEPFLIGVNDKYDLLKIETTGISRLNNKVFASTENIVFLNIVAPVGGNFALQSVGFKKSSYKLKLIPLKTAEARDIGVRVKEFDNSKGQSLAWTAESVFHALNIYDNQSGASSPALKSALDTSEGDTTADAKEDREPLSVLYAVDMKETIATYNLAEASGTEMDSDLILTAEKIHTFNRACHSMTANHKDNAKTFVMAFVCKDDNGVNQLVLSNGDRAVFVTSYTDTPVVGVPTLSKNGSLVAYTVQLSETSYAIAVMHTPTGTQSLLMTPHTLENIRLINPRFARNRPTILTYLVDRTISGTGSRKQVGVIDLKHHRTFGKQLPESTEDGYTPDAAIDEDLDYVFGEASEYLRADVDSL